MPRTAPSYRDYWPSISANIQRFGTDGIKPERRAEVERTAKAIIGDKDKYIQVEQAVRVPWPLLAAIHDRESESTHSGESSRNFNTYLGNGQRLDRRTTIEPTNRGPFCSTLPAPFSAFILGSKDACAIDGLSAVMQNGDIWDLGQRWGSWPIEKQIYYAIRFNGWGYYFHGVESPYAWGGTIIQQRGKYTSDGHFDPNVWDPQLGVAPLLWMIGYLDSTVHYNRET